MEQFKLIEDYGLIDHLDEIIISCIYNSEDSKNAFEILAKLYFKNVEISFYKNTIGSDSDITFIDRVNSDKSITENITLKKIYEDSKTENFLVLYMHSKGITYTVRFLQQMKIEEYRKCYYWRQYLNWGVIENWKNCVKLIEEGCDVASVNFMRRPYPHVSGNFWWSKSQYIRNLPDPTDESWYKAMQANSNDWGFKNAAIRFRDEMWITCTNKFKVGLIHNIEEENNPVRKFLPRKQYV
jgi:hypothetical protein